MNAGKRQKTTNCFNDAGCRIFSSGAQMWKLPRRLV